MVAAENVVSPVKLSKSEEKLKRNCPLTEIETDEVLTRRQSNLDFHIPPKQQQQKFTTIYLLIPHCHKIFCLIRLFVAHVKIKEVN